MYLSALDNINPRCVRPSHCRDNTKVSFLSSIAIAITTGNILDKSFFNCFGDWKVGLTFLCLTRGFEYFGEQQYPLQETFLKYYRADFNTSCQDLHLSTFSKHIHTGLNKFPEYVTQDACAKVSFYKKKKVSKSSTTLLIVHQKEFLQGPLHWYTTPIDNNLRRMSEEKSSPAYLKIENGPKYHCPATKTLDAQF